MPLIGPIQKMVATVDAGCDDAGSDGARPTDGPLPVIYSLPVGDEKVALNPHIGQTLRLQYQGTINCICCGRQTSKSFNQGYCYPCFTGLARCDMCIVKPEQCHFHLGTCREPEWGEANCIQEHSVYLANSSGTKVGISRGKHPITRWIDQGASQGLVFRSVPSRLDAGRVEVAFKRYVTDRTDWRKMLRAEPPMVDLERERDRLWELYRKGDASGERAQRAEQTEQTAPAEQADQTEQAGRAGLPGHAVPEARPVGIRYPVLHYPDKIKAFNLDKKPLAEGTLHGIKGQYLILDTGVLNIRKHAGYVVQVEARDADG